MSYLRDLHNFKSFLLDYKFEMLDVINIDGNLYCCGEPIMVDGKYIGEGKTWLNVTSSIQSTHCKMLSNLYPYDIRFDGRKLGSLEGFFQGIKFKNPKIQKEVLKYFGINALITKGASDYNWKETGIIYWKGKPIDRFSEEYDELTIRLYISAIQNELYRSALKTCHKKIVHIIGDENKKDSVFTREEFERMLNALREFLHEEDKKVYSFIRNTKKI